MESFERGIEKMRWLPGCFVLLLGLSGVSNAESLLETSNDYDIPPQRLSDALKAWADASEGNSINVLTNWPLIEGMRTTVHVKGKYAPPAALRLLLEGTALRFTIVNDRTVTIQSPEEGTVDGTDARANGQPPRRDWTWWRPAKRNSEPLDEVVVTGSKLGAMPSSNAGVLVIPRSELEERGFDSVQDALNSLPQMFGNTTDSHTNAVVSPFPAPLNPNKARALDLRGLGPGATLVLVDGKRTGRSAAAAGGLVDLSMVPLIAVERIEIFPVGASAIYGSDAIAGVANIILRKNFSGSLTGARIETQTHAGGTLRQVEQMLGKNSENGSLMAAYEYKEESAIDALHRDATKHVPQSDFLSADIRPEQSSHLAYVSASKTLASGADLAVDFFWGTRDTTSRYMTLEAGPQDAQSDFQTRQFGVNAGSAFRIGETWQGQLTAGIHQNEVKGDLARAGVSISGTSDTEEHKFRTWYAGADVTGSLFELPGGMVKAAFGTGVRGEYDRSGDSLRSVQSSNTRHRFLELEIPLVGHSGDAADPPSLMLRGAARREDYSSLGRSTVGMVGLHWMPNPSASVRARLGDSFKTPALDQVSPQGELRVITPLPGTSGVGDGTRMITLFGTNPHLEPETARTWDVGFDLTDVPLTDMRLSVTMFDIRYIGRIQSIIAPVPELLENPMYADVRWLRGHFSNPEFDEIAGSHLFEPPASGFIGGCSAPGYTMGPCAESPAGIGAIVDSRLKNIAGTHTRGLDIVLRQRIALRGAHLDLGVYATRVVDFEQWETPSSPRVDLVDTLFNPPAFRMGASVALDHSRWNVRLNLNHTNAYRNPTLDAGRRVASWQTVDLAVNYCGSGSHAAAWLDDMTVGLYVNNAIDRQPPYADNARHNGVVYDPPNANPFGRIISLKVTKLVGGQRPAGQAMCGRQPSFTP